MAKADTQKAKGDIGWQSARTFGQEQVFKTLKDRLKPICHHTLRTCPKRTIASATHFNKDCRFLLLDDVVNSFDAYKRPQLIDLVKDHLNEHQVVLLTHDRFWRDLLHRRLPTWKRINFTGYNFGVGPMMSPAMDALERVENALDKDEADDASGTFARYDEQGGFKCTCGKSQLKRVS
jgi:hypothetical protein